MKDVIFLHCYRYGATGDADQTVSIKPFIFNTIVKVVAIPRGSMVLAKDSLGDIATQYRVLESPEEIAALSELDDTTNLSISATQSFDVGITALGAAQGAGYAITKYYNEFDTVDVSGDAYGADLPAAPAADDHYVISNNDSADNLSVYPQTDGVINALAADAPLVIATGETYYFYALDDTYWVALKK